MSKSTSAISVDPISSLVYTVALLEDYDKEVDGGNKPKRSPYDNSIVIKLKDGTPYIIPDNIRQKAITKWNKLNNRSVSPNENANTYRRMEKQIYLFCIIWLLFLLYYSFIAIENTEN
jgi:hypothetical protein